MTDATQSTDDDAQAALTSTDAADDATLDTGQDGPDGVNPGLTPEGDAGDGSADTSRASSPTLYRAFVDRPTIGVVELWAESDEGPGDFAAATSPFPPLDDDRDLAYVGTGRAYSRRAIVDGLLDRQTAAPRSPDATENTERLTLLQRADKAGVPMTFHVVPVNYIGDVPVETEVKRTRKVGR